GHVVDRQLVAGRPASRSDQQVRAGEAGAGQRRRTGRSDRCSGERIAVETDRQRRAYGGASRRPAVESQDRQVLGVLAAMQMQCPEGYAGTEPEPVDATYLPGAITDRERSGFGIGERILGACALTTGIAGGTRGALI